MLGQLRNRLKRRLSGKSLPAPFYVAAHERSGMHFMINTITTNAVTRPGHYSTGDWNGPYVSGHPRQFLHTERLRNNWELIIASHSIIKTHNDRDLFDFKFPKAKAVYVLRDPRDTLVSLFYYFNHPANSRARWSAEHQYASVAEFLRRPASTYLRWANSRYGKSNNVVERWVYHVKGWLDADETIVVRYEELKTDFRGVLERLSRFLSLELLPYLSPVGLEDGPAILPRKGVIGDWRDHFTADDEVIVREAVEKVGLDWKAVTWRE
jgi:hypothetical protein